MLGSLTYPSCLLDIRMLSKSANVCMQQHRSACIIQVWTIGHDAQLYGAGEHPDQSMDRRWSNFSGGWKQHGENLDEFSVEVSMQSTFTSPWA